MTDEKNSAKIESFLALIIEDDIKIGKKHHLAIALMHIFVFYLFVLNLITSSEQMYQVPKDYYFYIAVIIFMLFLLFARKEKIAIVPTLVTITTGGVIMTGLFVAKKIGPQYYGPLYFQVILFSWIIFILFVILLVNSINSTIRNKQKFNHKEAFIFVATFAIPIVFNSRYLLPVIMPILAFMLSDFSKKTLHNLLPKLAIGYYLAFLHMMAKSFIKNSDRFEVGRFLGAFGQIESAGMFCAGAIVCVLFFFIRFRWQGEKSKLLYFMLVLFFVPPVYSTMIISSRSTFLALFFMIVMCFVFLCGKGNRKATILRGAFGLGIIVTSVLLMLMISSFWNKKASMGELDHPNYVQAHVMVLTNPGYRKGYFGEDSFLNILDRASSDRMKIWAESLGQISWNGHPYEGMYVSNGNEADDYIFTPHNFPILWLINYGLIGGLFVIVWYFRILIKLLFYCIHRDETFIFSTIWVFYSVGIFMFSCVNWTYPVGFMLLVLQGIISISDRWKGNECYEA
ncbi:MAG: O-antigen ligase family protein [Lachnospiraceae bacterium]|nr:O-antigen ligase family protein [Lachnospiraceae bacterium]